eukprot:363309-Chlamydomonas_euryale.AAC.1
MRSDGRRTSGTADFPEMVDHRAGDGGNDDGLEDAEVMEFGDEDLADSLPPPPSRSRGGGTDSEAMRAESMESVSDAGWSAKG